MPDLSFLDWPFLEARHRDWRNRVADFAEREIPRLVDHEEFLRTRCRSTLVVR